MHMCIDVKHVIFVTGPGKCDLKGCNACMLNFY